MDTDGIDHVVPGSPDPARNAASRDRAGGSVRRPAATVDPYGVDVSACRGRQRRLLEAVEQRHVDLLLLSRRESIQWLTGIHVRPPFEPLAAMTSAGHVTLVVPERQLGEPAAADELIGYEAKWHSTTRDDQQAVSAAVLRGALPTGSQPVACEFSFFGRYLAEAWQDQAVDVEPVIFQLRQRKDADELRMLRRANDANQAMYQHARQIVEPGVNELDVYAALHSVAVHVLGEPLTYLGQDFRSAARGGPPRDRVAQAGELYILDLGVGFRGYYSDNARTIAVGGDPTDDQRRAWEALAGVFPLVESTVCPGASCRALFESVQHLLDEFQPWVFNHHLGHGVGLAPEEGPHLNPYWDDAFAEGQFFTVEPGLYHDELRYGIRLEQNYIVTRDGVELLTDWPLGL
jgi:Xaa-Pro dipeptidase